jgi:hypothetical protein
VCKGDSHRRTVGERANALDGALAERLLPDQYGPSMVAQGTGDDFRRTRGSPVDQDDKPNVKNVLATPKDGFTGQIRIVRVILLVQGNALVRRYEAADYLLRALEPSPAWLGRLELQEPPRSVNCSDGLVGPKRGVAPPFPLGRWIGHASYGAAVRTAGDAEAWSLSRQSAIGRGGEGDAWHTAVTDRHSLTVAEGWGPTAELALARAVGAY